jgi:hypothetical protein
MQKTEQIISWFYKPFYDISLVRWPVKLRIHLIFLLQKVEKFCGALINLKNRPQKYPVFVIIINNLYNRPVEFCLLAEMF